VRAEVVTIDGLSGHADHGGLLAQLTPLAGTVGQVRLVHGGPEAAEALAAGLRAVGAADVAAAERGECVAL
jgi:metallo-beta-lactamase family protein